MVADYEILLLAGFNVPGVQVAVPEGESGCVGGGGGQEVAVMELCQNGDSEIERRRRRRGYA